MGKLIKLKSMRKVGTKKRRKAAKPGISVTRKSIRASVTRTQRAQKLPTKKIEGKRYTLYHTGIKSEISRLAKSYRENKFYVRCLKGKEGYELWVR